MKYKALFIDVDGTLVPNASKNPPSERVIQAIAKVYDKGLYVGLVTGRPIEYLSAILEYVPLSGVCVVNDGTQIIDAQTRSTLWEQPMTLEDVHAVRKVISQFVKRMYVYDTNTDVELVEGRKYHKPLGVFIDSLPPGDIDPLVNALADIPTIHVSRQTSYRTGQIDIWITHSGATKQHGLLQAAEIIGIDTKEIIGIGDSYNDFPLMLACGFKVAMGNAIPDLKAIADYVAPTVEDDGVADVIEKFILKT